MKLRWILLIAGLSFAASAILLAPVEILYGWAVPQPHPSLRLNGLQGTVMDGGFKSLQSGGRTVISDARWELRPAWLLLLRLTADLESSGDAVLRARVSRSAFGPLRISGLDAVSSIRSLLGATGQPVLPMDGQARLALQKLTLDDGWITEVEGAAVLQGLAWALARDPVPLGDYTAALSTDEKGLLASMADDGGPLELSGDARLRPDRSYDLHLQLRPRESASPSLRTLVKSLGAPDVRGWTHIRRQGTLAR